MTTDLADLVLSGRIESVEPDPKLAAELLMDAERHLASAAAIAATDSNGAYQLLYDGVRKAVVAHMTSEGFRATNQPGSHAAVMTYAAVALRTEASDNDLSRLDRMRRNRNRSEYSGAYFSVEDVDRDLGVARRVTNAVVVSLQVG